MEANHSGVVNLEGEFNNEGEKKNTTKNNAKAENNRLIWIIDWFKWINLKHHCIDIFFI